MQDQDIDAKTAAAIRDGLSWLADQQGEDGGWHSATYGAMRGGEFSIGGIVDGCR